MLGELIGDRIQFERKVKTWEEAVRKVMQPLLDEGYIQQSYVDAVIRNVNENGPYFIIIPGFAMPHARPECGAIKTGMAYLGLKKPVKFPGDNEVRCLVALSGENADSHVDAMAELAEILCDEDQVKKLFKSRKAEEVKRILK
ncbi:MAG: PTS sugar transporter subunit IIA [Enterococcus lemanii]|jgi:PTS system mannitol-specific IIA component